MDYKIAPTDQRPMPLVVTSEEFVTEWQACWSDWERDMSTLLDMAQPYLRQWQTQLTVPDSEKEVGYITLCKLISHNPIEALNKISNWVEYSSTYSSVREELELLFIRCVRTAGYFPDRAKPKIAEWVIAQNYRYRLKHLISGCRYWELAYSKSGGPSEVAVIPNWPDYLLLKNLKLDRWESYLLFWKLTGQSTMEISREIHVKRDTFYHEEKHIWDLLRKTYSGPE